MPESPELKVSRDVLHILAKDLIITDAYPSSTGRYAHQSIDGLDQFQQSLPNHNCSIQSVDVKGKFMYWTFSNGWYLHNTYGMTGQWLMQEDKHPCFTFKYDHPICQSSNAINSIVFNDPRHFGTIKFSNNKQELQTKLNKLGWDPLSQSLDFGIQFITQKLKGKHKPVGELMLDQTIFCGTGNYLRCEALHKTKISPWRSANSLSNLEVHNLCVNLNDIMQASYGMGGSTISTYKTPENKIGNYSEHFVVYGRQTDPAGYNVKREDMNGRTIHWVPQVQQ